jgi:shikimate kinase
MGSGKSTIAPILANALGYAHRDVDAEIESITGKRVNEIFSDDGEAFFREIEHRVLLGVSSQTDGCVVSLGGGTLANETNLGIVKSTGLLVYLQVDIDQIVRRMRFKTDRPLLNNDEGGRLDELELRQRIEHLLETRKPYYAQADLTITTGDRAVGVTVDDIVRMIRPFIV